MYAIKMEDDKSLTTTIHSTIYQGEKNADTLVFVVQMMYEDTNLADCTLLLRYVLPNGKGYSEELAMYPIPHNKEYYQFRLSATSHFTENVGDIDLWLTAVNFEDDIVLHTDTATVTVTQHIKIEDHLPPERVDQLDKLAAKVQSMEGGFVNNLKYDKDQETLQLTHNGAGVGDMIDVTTMVNHDEVIYFPDGEPKPDPNPDDPDAVIYF